MAYRLPAWFKEEFLPLYTGWNPEIEAMRFLPLIKQGGYPLAQAERDIRMTDAQLSRLIEAHPLGERAYREVQAMRERTWKAFAKLVNKNGSVN